MVGAGGAAALWLTARRQWTTEIGLNQKRIEQQATDHAFEYSRAHQVEPLPANPYRRLMRLPLVKTQHDYQAQ